MALDLAPKIKAKIDKLDFIKIQNACASKDSTEKIKRLQKWRKIFANHIVDKGLEYKIKNFYNSTTKRQTTLLKSQLRLPWQSSG